MLPDTESFPTFLSRSFTGLIDFNRPLQRRMVIRVRDESETRCLHLNKTYTFGHYFCHTCWAHTSKGEWVGGIHERVEPHRSNPYEADCND